MDDSALLLTHMEDLARKAQKTGLAHSKFLTASEAAQVQAVYKTRKELRFLLDGGFPGAERSIAVFLQPDWGVYDRENALAGLSIRYRQQDTLKHRDILGAVLGLGLSRDVLGDIHVQHVQLGDATAVCLASMADFIIAELRTAGRVGVTVSRRPLTELPDLSIALEEKTVSVASLRLDAVVAAAFHWSRSQAGEAIQAGRVQLAHRECLNLSQLVQQDDIISIRGKGRVKLLEIGGLTRKGRQNILLGYYV